MSPSSNSNLQGSSAVSKRPKTDKLTKEEAMILESFLDFAKKGEDELARFLLHCGINTVDIDFAGDIPSAILGHYRRPDGNYDLDAVAHDWFCWPPIAALLQRRAPPPSAA